nr:pyruvate dehydrogenase e1 component subunit beta-1, mitochondrial [Quercus suber]
MTLQEALNSALDEEMSADPNVFLMGEEVGQYQGAYKISIGLLKKYGPGRVLDTPITEAGFTGIGVGAAYHGLKPIVEFMTFNFSMQVLAPYSSEDDRGLLKAAIRDPDPVVFLENELFYEESFPVSEEVLDSNFFLPIGKAKIEREGKDVNITAFSRMVGYALKAAEILEKEGISAEVINLRSIYTLVIVEDGFPQHGVGSEICTSVIEESFYYLDAPVERITGADVPVSYNAGLERMSLPQVEDIVRAAKRTCNRWFRDGTRI